MAKRDEGAALPQVKRDEGATLPQVKRDEARRDALSARAIDIALEGAQLWRTRRRS